jgi:hypothetical protein
VTILSLLLISVNPQFSAFDCPRKCQQLNIEFVRATTNIVTEPVALPVLKTSGIFQ